MYTLRLMTPNENVEHEAYDFPLIILNKLHLLDDYRGLKFKNTVLELDKLCMFIVLLVA